MGTVGWIRKELEPRKLRSALVAQRDNMWNIERLISKGDYIYAVVPGHPAATKHGYVLHHRVIIENSLGRILLPSEIVHHKNHNKKDNRLENLSVMTRKEHSQHHKMGTGHGKVELVCNNCNKIFERAFRNRPDVKGNKQVFCSRICNGQFQRKQQLALVSPHASNVKKG